MAMLGIQLSIHNKPIFYLTKLLSRHARFYIGIVQKAGTRFCHHSPNGHTGSKYLNNTVGSATSVHPNHSIHYQTAYYKEGCRKQSRYILWTCLEVFARGVLTYMYLCLRPFTMTATMKRMDVDDSSDNENWNNCTGALSPACVTPTRGISTAKFIKEFKEFGEC